MVSTNDRFIKITDKRGTAGSVPRSTVNHKFMDELGYENAYRGKVVARGTSKQRRTYEAANAVDATVTFKNGKTTTIPWNEILRVLLHDKHTTHPYPLLLRKQWALKKLAVATKKTNGKVPDHYPECCAECCLLAAVVIRYMNDHRACYKGTEVDLNKDAWNHALKTHFDSVKDTNDDKNKRPCTWCKMRGHLVIKEPKDRSTLVDETILNEGEAALQEMRKVLDDG
jgi:hypothetical protein